jgi:hypothetical protein
MFTVLIPCNLLNGDRLHGVEKFSVIVYGLRNITILLSQCQILMMAMVTYEEMEDWLHTFLKSKCRWVLTFTRRNPNRTQSTPVVRIQEEAYRRFNNNCPCREFNFPIRIYGPLC